jgi:hypothetical protein
MTSHPDIAVLNKGPNRNCQILTKANQGYFRAMNHCPLNTLDNVFLPALSNRDWDSPHF